MHEAFEQFGAAIHKAGLQPELIERGKLHRFASNGKRSDDSGWYVFHDDGIPAGAFGDWRQRSLLVRFTGFFSILAEWSRAEMLQNDNGTPAANKKACPS